MPMIQTGEITGQISSGGASDGVGGDAAVEAAGSVNTVARTAELS